MHGIAGLALAAKKLYDDGEENHAYLWSLKRSFISGLGQIKDVFIHGDYDDELASAPHILSVGFKGLRSEVLLHALEEKEIYVSSGSACSSHNSKNSGVLMAINTHRDYLDSTVRFSFSEFTTPEEISYTLKTLEQIVPMLRKYS